MIHGDKYGEQSKKGEASARHGGSLTAESGVAPSFSVVTRTRDGYMLSEDVIL